MKTDKLMTSKQPGPKRYDPQQSQHPGNLIDQGRPVLPLAIDYAGKSKSLRERHHHARGQLLYAVSGVMQVATSGGTWVVVPQQAVWVPPRIDHQVGHETGIAMRTLYVDPDVATELPSTCCVVRISTLLQQLILRAMDAGLDYRPEGPEARLMLVIIDELRALKPEPMHLPHPEDPRLLKITRALLDDPADPRDLSEWAKRSGASSRTLARRFVAETGMTFGEWRERSRLLAAVPRLIDGDSVTRVAYDLGYQSPSAFIAMFKRNTGETPARFVRQKAG